MADKEYDILVIGATGYTGRLVLEYLANHQQAPSLRIAIGGRTLSKVRELANKYTNVGVLYVDVSDEGSVIDAVSKTRIVINIAGPYWSNGSVVVKACANNGVHHLDLTGEAPWVREIIQNYDYLAHKNRSVIVTCSGYDCIPADIAAYLAVQTLEKQLSGSGVPKPVHISSTAAHFFKGGVSGGTAATLFGAFEVVPSHKRQAGSGWALSPVPGPPGFSALPRFLSYLPRIHPRIYGGLFFMSPINEPIVRRSWGLRERYRREQLAKTGRSASPAPTFSYSEFGRTSGPISGILLSVAILAGMTAMALLPPFRWLVKQVLPKAGEGPAPENLDKGRFEVVNVAEGGGVAVKSQVIGRGDPGYRLTSIMIVESALLLLDRSNLTPLGQEGGILTPSAAFGDRLVQVLESTGRFQTYTEVLGDEESRKTR